MQVDPIAGPSKVGAKEDEGVVQMNPCRTLCCTMTETAFFGRYGSPVVPAMLGIGPQTVAGVIRAQRRAALDTGGIDAALSRAVLYVIAAERRMPMSASIATIRGA